MRTLRFGSILVLLIAVTACGNDISKGSGPVIIPDNNGGTGDAGNNGSMSDGGNNGGSKDMETVVPDATMTSPDAPEILEFSTNVDRLTEGESVTFTALLTDPDGLDDIVGGRLLEPNSGAVYGSFMGGGGSWTFTLSWDAIDQVEPIGFDSERTRVFTAEFLDAANNRSTRSSSITLHCNGEPACDGHCGDQQCQGSCRDATFFEANDNHCGSCGNACSSGEICDPENLQGEYQCVCATGDVCGGECVDTQTDPDYCGDCSTSCTGDQRCLEGLCKELNVMGPCSGETDCPEGLCFDEAQSGISGGVCLFPCEIDADQCPGGSVCVNSPQLEALPVCINTCTVDSDCRAEFECRTLDDVGRPDLLACAPPPMN